MRPATSLIGVSSGSVPLASLDGFVGDGGDAGRHDGSRQVLVGGEVEVGEDDLPGPHQRPFDRQRFLDLDDEVGVLPDVRGGRHDLGAEFGVAARR